jgi:hypothetical protein
MCLYHDTSGLLGYSSGIFAFSEVVRSYQCVWLSGSWKSIQSLHSSKRISDLVIVSFVTTDCT